MPWQESGSVSAILRWGREFAAPFSQKPNAIGDAITQARMGCQSIFLPLLKSFSKTGGVCSGLNFGFFRFCRAAVTLDLDDAGLFFASNMNIHLTVSGQIVK